MKNQTLLINLVHAMVAFEHTILKPVNPVLMASKQKADIAKAKAEKAANELIIARVNYLKDLFIETEIVHLKLIYSVPCKNVFIRDNRQRIHASGFDDVETFLLNSL